MIHSISHERSLRWRRSHRRRIRRAWIVIFVLIGLTVLVSLSGYFSQTPWLTLSISVGRTTYRLAAAYALAFVIGVPLALLAGWSKSSEFFFSIFDVLQNVPSFALFPIFIFLFGYTDKMIILFATSSIIWPILFAILTSIRDAHPDLNDAATIFGATGFKRMYAYLAPLASPAIITGSIVGIAIGWESVIGAEIISDTSGFGAFIKNASATSVSPDAIAGMLIILVIIFVVNRLVWTPLIAENTKKYATE